MPGHVPSVGVGDVNVDVRRRILERLDRIGANTYTGDDIRLLLIELRPALQRGSQLRDIADTVAHSEGRDQGPGHTEIGLTFDQIAKIGEKDRSPANIVVMSKDQWDRWRTAINRVPEKEWRDRFRMSKADVKALVGDNYVKGTDGYELSHLVDPPTLNKLLAIRNCSLGTLRCDHRIDQASLLRELKVAVNKVVKHQQHKYCAAINRQTSNIMVCLMCAMQHVTFRFSGEREARLYWSVGSEQKLCLCAVEDVSGVRVAVPHILSDYVVKDLEPGIYEKFCLEMKRGPRDIEPLWCKVANDDDV
jgi:hypothetical protein